jgi:micrococcal nuclease
MEVYRFNATVSRWVDGDTVHLDVDLGFSITVRETFRLANINTPETRGETRPAGLAALARARELAPEGTAVSVEVRKVADKYGRWLALIYTTTAARSVNDQLVAEGHAVPFMVTP